MQRQSTTSSRRVECTCQVCGKQFFARPYRVRNTGAKFCSRPCQYKCRVRLPIAERFWPKVNKYGPVPTHVPELDPCWEWTGAKLKAGYGLIGTESHRRPALTHRLSWELHYGPIPDGLFVCHYCDNPSCVNPLHLFLGKNQDNVTDMVLKGRHGHGVRYGHGKLNDAAVRELRLQAARGVPSSALADRFGITPGHARKIVRGDLWRHVTEAQVPASTL